MAALNPEIIKDTKSLISLYQGNTRFKTAFDRIVANNINAIYKGRPVKLYVEVLANVSSTYKRDYDRVKRISLHDKEGKVGELFKKIKPNDFFLLDAATRAAQQNLNNTSYGDKEVEQINKIEADAKNNKEKREAHQQRLESELSEKQEEEKVEPETKTESEKEQAGEHKPEEAETKPATEQEKKQATPIVPGENPEHKKSYNPASQEEKARVEAILNQPKEEIPKEVFISPTGKVLIKPAKTQEEVPQHILIGPSGEPIRNIRPETEPEAQQEISEVIPDIRPEIQPEVQSEPSEKPSIPSIPKIPRPSGFRQFISSPRASVNNLFRGSASTGKVVARGTTRAIGKLGLNTAIKAGAGAATKLGASILAGAATGGVGLIIGIAASLPDETKKFFKLIFWIVIGLIAFIAVMFVFQRGEKMNSLLPPYEVPTMDSVGPISGEDITSCKFYRANESASYKSKLLLSYISEASNLSGIPPAVFAAFIRVESPSSVNMNDDQIKNYAANCAVSSTGALGIMQIQPPGTTSARGDPASCVDCIDAGAKLLGKTVQSMIRSDYCDPRTNIIVGSGWILKKMGYLGYQNSGKWNPSWTNDQGAINSLVSTYYGCLKYGGSQDCTGPYNYGNDVWTSIQNCQPTSPTPSGSFNSYFCQHNPSWASLPISNSGDTMSSGGCGLTSIAMILNYFGLPYTPTEVLTKFNQNPSWYTYAGGTSIYSALEWVKSLGFEVVDLNPDVSNLERDIPKYLNSGYLILGSQYISSPLSHIFIVSSSLPNGHIILEDPDKSCQPNLDRTITGVMEGYSSPTYGKWMYAKAIKKVR